MRALLKQPTRDYLGLKKPDKPSSRPTVPHPMHSMRLIDLPIPCDELRISLGIGPGRENCEIAGLRGVELRKCEIAELRNFPMRNEGRFNETSVADPTINFAISQSRNFAILPPRFPLHLLQRFRNKRSNLVSLLTTIR